MFDHPSIDKLRATIRAASQHYEEPPDMKTCESIARAAKLPASTVQAAITMGGVQPSEFVAGQAHYDTAAQTVILETIVAGRKASASAERTQREAKAKSKQPTRLAQVERALEAAIGLHDSTEFTTEMLHRAYAAAEGRELHDDIRSVLAFASAHEGRDGVRHKNPDRKHRFTSPENIAANMMTSATRATGKKWKPRG